MGHSETTFSAAAADDAQDLKMIHWYKLANEAAMKAALVKHKRFKEVPRFDSPNCIFCFLFCDVCSASDTILLPNESGKERNGWSKLLLRSKTNL
jgi:formate hydrogenlyase subunit 6/NADH:ubiquinone oxidoreductase subunit I